MSNSVKYSVEMRDSANIIAMTADRAMFECEWGFGIDPRVPGG